MGERLKALERAVDPEAAETPPPGPHNCEHQKESHFPCAYPSCPDSPRGNFYRTKVRRKDGSVFKVQFKRVRQLVKRTPVLTPEQQAAPVADVTPETVVVYSWRPA